MNVKVTFFCILFNFLPTNSNLPSNIVFSPSELTKSDIISNSTLKAALRYGFHRTSECNDFEKAYICVQKCVDLNYDIAYSDKYCFCTCYVKKEKAKYTPRSPFVKTKWRLGAPSTTKPAWADKNKKLQSKVTITVASTKRIKDVTDHEKFIQSLNDTENIATSSDIAPTKDESEGTNANSGTENATDKNLNTEAPKTTSSDNSTDKPN